MSAFAFARVHTKYAGPIYGIIEFWQLSATEFILRYIIGLFRCRLFTCLYFIDSINFYFIKTLDWLLILGIRAILLITRIAVLLLHNHVFFSIKYNDAFVLYILYLLLCYTRHALHITNFLR